MRSSRTQKNSTTPDNREKLKQKTVETEDVCPICQEEFLQQPEPLTYCRYSKVSVA